MKTILFQGDSITDCGRDRSLSVDCPYLTSAHMGNGYALLAAAQVGYEHPGEYKFINRGISGDRIVDVYARIKADILNLKPDYMSLLIGVNDVWHEFDLHNGVDAEKFGKLYDMLIGEVKAALPDIQIVIFEPYVMRGIGTDNTEAIPDKWNTFCTEVKKRAEKAKAVAEKYGLPFVTLQDKFDAAAEKAPASHWLSDGVHPTPFGHELIKREWLKAFNDIL